MVKTIDWLTDVSEEYSVSISVLTEVYITISKFIVNETKVRNIIEQGLTEAKGDVHV